MARRKELRGAAIGILGAFVSRNNDIDGYWALGRLYEHAVKSNVSNVCIDLLNFTTTPSSTEFAPMVEHFAHMLAEQLAARQLPSGWLKAALIRVEFTHRKSPDKPGDVFDCAVTIEDDKNRTHIARESGSCWLHDPARELRSTRV